ncbi:MAG: peptidase M15A [Prochlorotrichaceae cyanobacterium]
MTFSPKQQQWFYRTQAEAWGVHSPLLAALHQVQSTPPLADEAMGLGIVPAPGVPFAAVNSVEGQVSWAAQTLRALTYRLIRAGWRGQDFWNSALGEYSDRFVREVANGFRPVAIDEAAAQLEPCNPEALHRAYQQEVQSLWDELNLDPPEQTQIDRQLLSFVDRLPQFYRGLSYQRRAVEAALALWFPQTPEIALAEDQQSPDFLSEPRLLAQLAQLSQQYEGTPPQREALLRLVQRWWQLDCREVAIVTLLQETTPLTDLSILDSALINCVEGIPAHYERSANQRYALTEAFRLWQNLEERSAALVQLGVDPLVFSKAEVRSTDFQDAALQVDRALLAFVRQIPLTYQALDAQRQALIRLVQIWRNIETQPQAIDSLILDLQQMEHARRHSPEAPRTPTPATLRESPPTWTRENLQLFAPILPGGTLTWATATAGGLYLPQEPWVIEGIQRLAGLVQQASDRLGRPLQILHWYNPNPLPPPFSSRHSLGDGLLGYGEGLTAKQVYWALDPWWPGGLGYYAAYPSLIYLDARSDRVRQLFHGAINHQ